MTLKVYPNETSYKIVTIDLGSPHSYLPVGYGGKTGSVWACDGDFNLRANSISDDIMPITSSLNFPKPIPFTFSELYVQNSIQAGKEVKFILMDPTTNTFYLVNDNFDNTSRLSDGDDPDKNGWELGTVDTGCAVEIDNAQAYSGTLSLKTLAPANTSGVTKYAQGKIFFPMVSSLSSKSAL